MVKFPIYSVYLESRILESFASLLNITKYLLRELEAKYSSRKMTRKNENCF